jgi:hypothetical protein
MAAALMRRLGRAETAANDTQKSGLLLDFAAAASQALAGAECLQFKQVWGKWVALLGQKSTAPQFGHTSLTRPLIVGLLSIRG